MKESYYKYLSEKKLTEEHWWFKARTRIICEILTNYLFTGSNNKSKNKAIKILDIGSGMGQLSKALQKFGMVFGVESNKLSFETSEKKNFGIVFWNDYFPDKNSLKYKYDLICMCDFIEHISNLDIILKEVHNE